MAGPNLIDRRDVGLGGHQVGRFAADTPAGVIRVHDRSCSCTTHQLEAGVNLHRIQEALGHPSPSTPAISMPLPTKAHEMAADSINRLLADLSRSRDRTGKETCLTLTIGRFSPVISANRLSAVR